MSQFKYAGTVLGANHAVVGNILEVNERVFIVCEADIEGYGEGSGTDLYATEFYEVDVNSVELLEGGAAE